MGPKKRHPLRRKRLAEIEPSEHPYDIRSKDWLRAHLYEDIKKLFVGALRSVETRLGTGFEGFEGLRSEILRMGNDCIRNMHRYMDSVNVEFVPRTIIKVSANSGPHDKIETEARDEGKEAENGSQEAD
jgi:hypothetical protein